MNSKSIPFSVKKKMVPLRTEQASANSPMITGLKMKMAQTLMRLSLVRIAAKCYRNPLDWIRSLRFLVRLRKRFLGDYHLQKVAKVDGSYYLGIYIPAWFTSGFENFVISKLISFKPVHLKINRFNIVHLSITSKCPLQCDHCYEWDRLNDKDTLSIPKMERILKKLQDVGINQIHFTGGEPLMKFDKLLIAINYVQSSIVSWINTSGYSLTPEKARHLKNAGLTGIIVSLDHFDQHQHNTFRNHNESFYWVTQAIKNGIKNNLVVALSICINRAFASEQNLMSYMILARDLGVSFVQFLEPKAVGHYKDKNVELTAEQMDLLESFFLKMNYNSKFRNFPIINYHGYYQRRIGCQSAGVQSIYIDADGDLNACPFCQNKSGNILDDNFDLCLEALIKKGCANYEISEEEIFPLKTTPRAELMETD